MTAAGRHYAASVLLAVRDPHLAESVEDYLASCYFRVTRSPGAYNTADLVRQGKFDVLVLDMDYAECRSGSALKLLGETQPRNPRMRTLLIGSLEPAADKIPPGLAVMGYLLKPFDPGWLVRLIRQAADHADLEAGSAQSEELRERMASLQARSHWSELAAGLTHEIKNLLSVIKVSAQFLLKKGHEASLDPRFVKHLNIISQQVDRSQEQILRFGAMASGSAAARDRCDANAIIGELLALLEYTLASRNITVKTELAPTLPTLELDEGALRTILLNLIFNARDSMPDGGTLTVSTAARETPGNGGPRIEIAVQDTGGGIADDMLERVFEPFFTTKVGPQSSGLGLSLSRQLAAGFGGDLAAVRGQQPGALFVLTIPVAAAVSRPARRTADAAEATAPETSQQPKADDMKDSA